VSWCPLGVLWAESPPKESGKKEARGEGGENWRGGGKRRKGGGKRREEKREGERRDLGGKMRGRGGGNGKNEPRGCGYPASWASNRGLSKKKSDEDWDESGKGGGWSQ